MASNCSHSQVDERTCFYCKISACQECGVEGPFLTNSLIPLLCIPCFSLLSLRKESVSELTRHSAKELREYLRCHGIEVPAHCCEKRDLAELIASTPILFSHESFSMAYLSERAKTKEAERKEQEGRERERIERERAQRERAERERVLRERAERERVQRERAERERVQREIAERERERRERAEREAIQRERAERETIQRERAERERLQRERAERERIQRERAEREATQRERAEREAIQRERAERERAERERIQRDRAERERSGHETEVTIETLSLNRDSIRGLSIRQLKIILSENRIDFSGALEREELIGALDTLLDNYLKEQAFARQSEEEGNDSELCICCFEQIKNSVFLECGHMACCLNCGSKMEECPLCRKPIFRVIRVFRS